MVSFQGMGKAALGAMPAFGELTDRVLFGEVWERACLGKRERSLVTVACLLAMHRPEQLTVVVQTTSMEDWSFSDGVPAPQAIEGATP